MARVIFIFSPFTLYGFQLEDTIPSNVLPSAAKPDKPKARTQQKKTSKESRIGSSRDSKRAPGTASKTTTRKFERKVTIQSKV